MYENCKILYFKNHAAAHMESGPLRKLSKLIAEKVVIEPCTIRQWDPNLISVMSHGDSGSYIRVRRTLKLSVACIYIVI